MIIIQLWSHCVLIFNTKYCIRKDICLEYNILIKQLTRKERFDIVEFLKIHQDEYVEEKSVLGIALKYKMERIIEELLNNYNYFINIFDTKAAIRYNKIDILRKICNKLDHDMLLISTENIQIDTLK